LGLISRPVGPFVAGVDLIVPTWLGLMLRKKGLCKIIAPDWMDVTFLQSILDIERDPAIASFAPNLPHRYAELARSLLEVCHTSSSASGGLGGTDARNATAMDLGGGGEEIPNAAQVKLLLEDIATVRMDKIRKNVHDLSNNTLSKERHVPIIDVSGIGSLEILAVRPFLQRAFRDQNRMATAPKSVTLPPSRSNRRTSSSATSARDDDNDDEVEEPQKPSNRIRRFR